MIPWVASGVVFAAGAALALGLYGARELTRSFHQGPSSPAPGLALPSPEEVRISEPGQPTVRAWWFLSPAAGASVLACHGHGGSKEQNLWLAAMLYPLFHVLLIDVRGHGESDGDLVSVGYLERLDVIRGAQWIAARTLGRPVGVFGLSMGGVAAILAAADEPMIAAVAADSPFARLRDSLRRAILLRGFPVVVADWFPPLIQFLARYPLRLVGKPWLDPIHVVDRLAPRPLLIIHGEADSLTPAAGARELYARAGEPKQLWIVPGVEHAQVATEHPEEYRRRIVEFFAHALDVAGTDPPRFGTLTQLPPSTVA